MPRKEWLCPPLPHPPLSPSVSLPCLPPQSIQPTANLDRTDDLVYLNVMELVRAVLDLKNKLCQLPPEGYVVVVKVRAGGEPGAGEVEAAHPSPGMRGRGQQGPH